MAQTRPRVFTKNEEIAVSPLDLPVSSPVDNYLPSTPSETFRDEMPLLGLKGVEIEEVPSKTLSIKLSKDLYDEYKRIADAQELTVEEVVQHRLESCKTHNAIRGLWFSDSERTQLENMMQKWPLESASQALSSIARAATVRFDDIQVTLTPAQKRSLAQSNFRGRTPEGFFMALIQKELKV